MRNLAVGGETSSQIAARANAWPTTITLDGPIPASSASSVLGDTSVGIPSAQSGSLTAYVLDVPVVLSYSSGRCSVRRRETAADPLTVPAGTPVTFEHGLTAAWDRQVVWVGRNDGQPRTMTVPDRVARIIGRGHTGRSLVLGVTNNSAEPSGSSAHADILATNAALAAVYGDRYLDIRTYLVTDGLAAAGITPTSQDLADVAADIIPVSLRSDSTHLNAPGYTLVGQQIHARLQTLGWV